MDDLLKELTVIFREILDNNNIQITENTSAEDIEEWDSLSHIQLVVAIEKHFHIKFTSVEIQKWKNVGDMYRSITAKLQSK